MTYSSTVLADSPLGLWELEETSGATAANAGSASSANGTISGGVTLNQTGIAGGKGFSFDGTSGTVAIPSTFTDFTLNGIFTLEGWFKVGTTVSQANPTIIRRDGGGRTVLVRLDGSSDATNPNQVEAYVFGTFLRSGSSHQINTNTWHHVALVANGANVSLYLDGVSVASSTTVSGWGTMVGGSQAFNIGGNTAGEFFGGNLDEVAVYPTALSSTQVANHYAAGGPNGGYTATPMTATGSFPNATFSSPSNFVATPATASGLIAGTPFAATANVTLTTVTGDRLGEDSPAYTSQSSTNGNVYIKPDLSVFKAGDKIGRADFTVTVGASSGNSFYIESVDAPFTLNGSPFTEPAGGAISSGPYTLNTSGNVAFTKEVTKIINAIRSGTAYGMRLRGTTTGMSFFNSAAGGGLASVLTATYLPVPDAVEVATPMTGSGLLVAPVINLDAVTNAAPMTGTAGLVEPVETTGTIVMAAPALATANAGDAKLADYVALASPATATGSMAGGGFALPINNVATPMTASGLMVDSTVATIGNALPNAGAATALASFSPPIEAQNTKDDYYNKIMSTLPLYSAAWMMDQSSGSTVLVEPVAGVKPASDLPIVGNYNWNGFGLMSRRRLHIDSGYIGPDTIDHGANLLDRQDIPEWTLEMLVRTANDGTLMFGYGSGTNAAQPITTTVSLVGGKVSLVRNGITMATGRFNVSDNNWHHIVVAVANDGVKIYIDGQLDVRRFHNASGLNWGEEHYFLGNPNDTTVSFNGEVERIVYRVGTPYAQNVQNDLFFAAFGIVPVRATPMLATAATGQNVIAKGNTPRMMIVGSTPGQNAPIKKSALGPNFDILPYEDVDSAFTRWAGYDIFFYPFSDHNYMRDAITDDIRFIDFENDVDVSQFDVITFNMVPDADIDRQNLLNEEIHGVGPTVFTNYSAAYANARWADMLASLRKVIDKGANVLITNPRMATEMGIVDRVEVLPTFDEGLQDAHAKSIDPWQDLFGVNYYDTHKNDRFRVNATIAGLTDIPSLIVSDVIHKIPTLENSMRDIDRYEFKYLDRTNGGLEIGDEFVFAGPAAGQGNGYPFTNGLSAANDFNDYGRGANIVAVPPTAVKAGTIVTTLGSTVWQASTAIVNPYKDYATTIAIQPGDLWNGTPSGGKVFFTFTEQLIGTETPFDVYFQVVPDSANETAAQKAWQYSEERLAIGFTASLSGGVAVDVNGNPITTDAGTGSQVGTNTAGGIKTVVQGGIQGQLSSVEINEKYPLQKMGQQFSMFARGLQWLKNRIHLASGEINFRQAGATATATTVDPVVSIQASVSVNAGVAVARGEFKAPAEAHNPDVNVYTFPATARAEMAGYASQNHPLVATGSATMVEPRVTADVSGDHISVYVETATTINMYLKEDT